jgi:hypothetical protein
VDQGNLDKQSGSQIHCSEVTSVNSVLNNVSVYPNPVKDGSVLFKSSDNEITGISIIDLTGKIVRKIPGHAKREEIADVSELIRGIYLFVVDTQNDSMHYKIVLE